MASQQQIMQAFQEYQSGRGFISDECEYRLHTSEGTKVSKRAVEREYLARR